MPLCFFLVFFDIYDVCDATIHNCMCSDQFIPNHPLSSTAAVVAGCRFGFLVGEIMSLYRPLLLQCAQRAKSNRYTRGTVRKWLECWSAPSKLCRRHNNKSIANTRYNSGALTIPDKRDSLILVATRARPIYWFWRYWPITDILIEAYMLSMSANIKNVVLKIQMG